MCKMAFMFCLLSQMIGPEVSQSEEPISNQALLMGIGKSILDPLAPLLVSSYVTEACLVPFLETLCNLSTPSELNKIKTPVGKKRRLMLFLDMMWAFFEVRFLAECHHGDNIQLYYRA
jgi:hypothetical protein